MGSLGLPEIAFIFILALLVFGPRKLPEIGRTLGRGVAEFRKATNELKRSINTELALEEMPSPTSLRSLNLDDLAEPPRRQAGQPAEPGGESPGMTEPRAALPLSHDPEPQPAAEPDAREPR